MAVVKPFRALRYDEAKAGPLASLVAPPYDVIGDDERRGYLGRSERNIVHLTLPESEEEAARALADWRAQGFLARDEDEAVWALTQTYTGPDGEERTRKGLVVSLRVEPYERRVVLPHERTHAGPKEGRLRLLRATRTQLEPIFLLHEGEPVEIPARPPDLEVGGDRLWRLEPDAIAGRFDDAQLLIADGHHRYETALAFHEEDGSEASAYLMAVLVPTRQDGLTIFPTHRVFERRPEIALAAEREEIADPASALKALDRLPHDRPAAVAYGSGRTDLLRGTDHELDVQLVDRLGHDGIAYTPDWKDAVARVDRGDAEEAFLLRPTRIEDVFTLARRGEVLPQKSTYFYPKLTSGLLLHPLD
jgi:uncharacterized protein (DUF1015 family)